MTDRKPSTHEDASAAALCPICQVRPQTAEYRPFCSKRCADVDLHRWLGGVYAIPSRPEEDEDEMPAGLPRSEE